MQAFKENRLYKRDGTKRNDATKIVISLCLIFDLNFKRSLEIIKDKGIIERKIEILEHHLNERILENIINEFNVLEIEKIQKFSISNFLFGITF